nr:hypothetical protein [Tanacetum cinerariifolium]
MPRIHTAIQEEEPPTLSEVPYNVFKSSISRQNLDGESLSMGPRAPHQQQTQAISPFTNFGSSGIPTGGYGVKKNEHQNRDSFDSSMDVDHDSSTY